MAIWNNIATTCFGVTYQNAGNNNWYTYRWNGHSFWPSYEAQGFVEGSYVWNTVSAYGQTTSFNCSGFQSGNEVVMFLNEIRWDAGYSGYWTLSFEDAYGTELFSRDYSGTFDAPPPGYESGLWAWIGIGVRPQPWPELWRNGTYYAISTGVAPSSTTFTVSNIASDTLVRHPGSEGYMWVEGQNLCYICAMGTKVKILAQPGGEVSVASQGYVWISNNSYRIYWVDATGVMRKSKLGDRYWTEGWDEGTEYVGTFSTGYTYVRSNPGWTELHYVAYDGYLVRHGPGYVNGDMQ